MCFLTDLSVEGLLYCKKKRTNKYMLILFKSGRQDSNLRPPGPKPGTLTGLRYAPNIAAFINAVRPGFEPGVPFDRYDGLANRWFQPLTHLTKVLLLLVAFF